MPNQAIPKLNRERASDAVFSILRERILSHSFKPGERLNIRVAAEQLGVMMQPRTWNDILGAMIAVRDAHSWQQEGRSPTLPALNRVVPVVARRSSSGAASQLI